MLWNLYYNARAFDVSGGRKSSDYQISTQKSKAKKIAETIPCSIGRKKTFTAQIWRYNNVLQNKIKCLFLYFSARRRIFFCTIQITILYVGACSPTVYLPPITPKCKLFLFHFRRSRIWPLRTCTTWPVTSSPGWSSGRSAWGGRCSSYGSGTGSNSSNNITTSRSLMEKVSKGENSDFVVKGCRRSDLVVPNDELAASHALKFPSISDGSILTHKKSPNFQRLIFRCYVFSKQIVLVNILVQDTEKNYHSGKSWQISHLLQ